MIFVNSICLFWNEEWKKDKQVIVLILDKMKLKKLPQISPISPILIDEINLVLFHCQNTVKWKLQNSEYRNIPKLANIRILCFFYICHFCHVFSNESETFFLQSWPVCTCFFSRCQLQSNTVLFDCLHFRFKKRKKMTLFMFEWLHHMMGCFE